MNPLLQAAFDKAQRVGGKLVWMDAAHQQVRVLNQDQLEHHSKFHPVEEFRLVLPITQETVK